MDEMQLGRRNKRGDWTPNAHLDLPPWTRGDWHPRTLLNWAIGYLWPWNLIKLIATIVVCQWVLPDAATMQTLEWGWALKLFAFNWVALFVFYAYFEWRYYLRRQQGTRFKYNGRFPADQPSDVFWFKSQNLDNFIRSFLISIPIGTALEVFALWAFASGMVPTVSWSEHPYYLAALVFLAPALHEVHFFVIHAAIHWGPLYRWVHAVHHNSINPTPWSSMSMHPVEGFFYFALLLWALVIPSHPFVMVFLFSSAAYGAIVGHLGFDRFEHGVESIGPTSAYSHYLHHKYFEVNYSDPGFFPLDQWMGSWHDGSPEGERLMQERFRKKQERVNAT